MTTLLLSAGESINEALLNAPEGPLTIMLGKGVWEEKVFITRPDVTLISEEGAVITYFDRHGDNRDGHILNTGESATFTVAAPNFSAIGITFRNSFNWPAGVRWNEENDEGKKMDLQAVALRIAFGATRSTFRSCTVDGWQDSLYVDYGVSLFADCTIKGSVDFIFGAGSALFQGCEIVSLARGFVTAPSTFASDEIGFVFHDSSFTRTESVGDDTVYLARPWYPSGAENRSPMALFIDPEMEKHINPALFTDMASRRPGEEKVLHKAEEARFYITSPERENIKAEKADSYLEELLSKF